MLDTVASLETGCPRLIAAHELADFPLPAPDTIWCAPDAVAWAQALSSSLAAHKTLAIALGYLFIPPGEAEPACLNEAKWQSGSFGWLCLVLTITREVVELGEGKRRSASVGVGGGGGGGGGHEGEGDLRWASWAKDDEMPAELAGALERWRRGWDFDSLTSPVLPTACENVYDDEPPPTPVVAGAPSTTTAGGGLGLFEPGVTPDSFSASPSGRSSGSSSRPADPPYADVYFCREAVRSLLRSALSVPSLHPLPLSSI